jgi:hypothetical protein
MVKAEEFQTGIANGAESCRFATQPPDHRYLRRYPDGWATRALRHLVSIDRSSGMLELV